MNKRHWSAVSGLAVGALVVTGLTAPMQAQATPGCQGPGERRPRCGPGLAPDNLPNPLAEAQAAERKDAVAKLLKGEATTKTINGNRVIEVKTHGQERQGRQVQVRQLPGEPRGGHLHDPRRLRRHRRNAAHRRHGRPGAQPDRRSPTATGTATRPTTTRPTGSRTSTASTTTDLMFGRRRVVQGLLPQAVQRPLPRQGRRLRLGQGALQRGALRLQRVLRQLDGYWPFIKDTAQRLVRRPEGRGQDATPRSRPTSRSSTRSTATTTTATATSTSPTATSTTSRRSTPVRARRPAAAPRARTPSGRTAGTPTPTSAGKTGPDGNKLGGVPARQHRHVDR